MSKPQAPEEPGDDRLETTNLNHKRGYRRYKIDRTLVASWTAKLPDEGRSLIFWLHDYAASRDLELDELGKRLKQPNGQPYSRDSVYQVMTGRRTTEQLGNFLSAVEDLRKIETERSKITRIGFVETDITKRIFQVCDATRNFGKMGVLIGPTHIGKTIALREYAERNNHGATTYVRMVAGGSKSAFIRRLAQKLNVGISGNDYTIGSRLFGSFDERMLLIVDEFHQCFPRASAYHRQSGARPSVYFTVEWLRELHDLSGCAILLSTTPVYDAALKDDFFSGIFKQTLQRSLITCRLPDRPTKKSLNQFSKHFGLPPAEGEALDLQTSTLRDDSLGRWVSILEGASRIASAEGKSLDWSHVLKSHAALLKLESGD